MKTALEEAQDNAILCQMYLARALEAEKECWDIVAESNRRLKQASLPWWKLYLRKG